LIVQRRVALDATHLGEVPADTSCTSAAGDSEACTGEQDPIGAIVAACAR